MNPATITSSTVRILAGGVPVTGNLAYGASYVVEVNTGATDAAGNALADTFTGTFATRGAPSADVWGMARLDNNFTVLYDNATRTATLSWSALSSLDNVLVSAYSMQDDPNTGGRVAVPWDNTSVRDGSGEFAFDNTFPSSTYSFTAEKRNETGPASRILCVTTLFFGGSSEIPITMQDVTPTPVESRLDRYCRGCHPDTPTRGKVQRCLHRSGMTPVNYRPDDNSVVTLEEYDRVTCESCHTAHRPTPYLYFLRLSHVDPAQGLLCTQCH